MLMGIIKKTYRRVFWIVFVIVFISITLFVGKFIYELFFPFMTYYDAAGSGESLYANLTPTLTKSGSLADDEIWSGVVLVEGDVIVPKGKTLTIDPGTVVKFSSNRDWGDTSDFSVENYKNYPRSKLIIYGNLISEGTPEKLIVFTSNETLPQGGDWFGILFKQDCFSTKTSSIKYSIIEYGLKNVVISYENGEFCSKNPLLLENNIVRHANKNIECLEPDPKGPYLRANGIEIHGYPVTVRGNIIYDNFKGIGNDFPSLIENNIIAFHNQQCWGDAPGTGIRTTGVDAEVWKKEAEKASLVIQNNLFFQKPLGNGDGWFCACKNQE